MGPLPELPDIKWLLILATVGVLSIVGALGLALWWLILHVRFV